MDNNKQSLETIPPEVIRELTEQEKLIIGIVTGLVILIIGTYVIYHLKKNNSIKKPSYRNVYPRY